MTMKLMNHKCTECHQNIALHFFLIPTFFLVFQLFWCIPTFFSRPRFFSHVPTFFSRSNIFLAFRAFSRIPTFFSRANIFLVFCSLSQLFSRLFFFDLFPDFFLAFSLVYFVKALSWQKNQNSGSKAPTVWNIIYGFRVN